MIDLASQGPLVDPPGCGPPQRLGSGGTYCHMSPMSDDKDLITPAMPAPDPAPREKGEDSRPREIGGPKGPEPTRYGDWEVGGRCTDF